MPLSLLASPSAPLLEAGGLGPYLMAFGQGVLVDLTPCVYPLIPITVAVFGAKGVSKPRALLLASAYVLGMAALYTSLGVLVALTGGQFGAWLGSPVVVLPITALLLALAASMFGAFDIQLPSSLQTRLNTVGGAGPLGAFLMGLVSGFISAPCTGPVLLSLLAYIAKSAAEGRSVAYGGSLLFVYALGMGSLFFVVALGASLFRPGRWMEYVKSFFGIGLLVMALWFLAPLIPSLRDFILDPAWGLYAGVGLALTGVALGAIHLSFYGGAGEKLRKAIAIAVVVVGAQLVLNNILHVDLGEWRKIETLADFEAVVAEAEAAERPYLIDFGAEWCTPCKEMEVQTFAHEGVKGELESRFFRLKIDVTDPNPDQKALFTSLVDGNLPGVVVYPSSAGLSEHFEAIRAGKAAPDPAMDIRALMPPAEFLPQLQAVR
ncbi:MAG: thioredoxin family protein [Myxococcales bacterium]|nr:thioredoxin family protein [Myxococcales bacterium]